MIPRFIVAGEEVGRRTGEIGCRPWCFKADESLTHEFVDERIDVILCLVSSEAHPRDCRRVGRIHKRIETPDWYRSRFCTRRYEPKSFNRRLRMRTWRLSTTSRRTGVVFEDLAPTDTSLSLDCRSEGELQNHTELEPGCTHSIIRKRSGAN